MDNSVAAGRSLAVRVVVAQIVMVGVVAAAFLGAGGLPAMAVLGGGLTVVVGTALLALRVFAPPLARTEVVLRRFALGTLLKWLVVLGGLSLALGRMRLPLVPVLAGAGAAMVANWLILWFDVRYRVRLD